MVGKVSSDYEKEYVKGSSKPDGEPSLKHIIAKKITSQMVYRKGSEILDVAEIDEININNTDKGEYILSKEEVFDFIFEGDAQIGIRNSSEIIYHFRKIRGYYKIGEGENIILYHDILVV